MHKKNIVQSVFLILVMVVISACGNKIENPLNWQVGNFSFKDQENQTYGLANLKGKVWLADFMFTNCTSVCTPMTIHLSSLQKKIKQQGSQIEIVSFSVDPKHDTDKVLKEFAQKFNVDFSNWHFLTGYTQETITNLALDSFKAPVEMDPNSNQVMHSTSFFLVDSAGKIVKRYDGIDQKTDEQVLQDIKILTKK